MRILIIAISEQALASEKRASPGHYLSTAAPRQEALFRINADSKGRRRKRKTSLAVNNRAAIGMEHLPGHIRAILGSQENIASGNLARLTRPFHGNILAELGNFIGRKGGRY